MKNTVKKKRVIPFAFVLDLLDPMEPVVRPMFGCWAVYVKEKIVLILRDKPGVDHDNGVWVATATEHHESLRREFPELRSLELFGIGETNWQNFPSEADDFEEDVGRICRLILSEDPRIGRVPKRKSKSLKAKRPVRKRRKVSK